MLFGKWNWNGKIAGRRPVVQKFEEPEEAMQAAFESLAGKCFGMELKPIRHRLMRRFIEFSPRRSKRKLARAWNSTKAFAQVLMATL